MNLVAIIQQLRLHCPALSGNVAGAAEFHAAVEDEAYLPLPAAYVIPLDDDDGPNENQTGLFQRGTERFGVIVVFDNATDLVNDRRGQAATSNYGPMKLALRAALLNWIPPPIPGDVVRSARGLYAAGGELVSADRARLFYQWVFALDVQFTGADGFQATFDSLEQVDATTTTGVEALILVPQY